MSWKNRNAIAEYLVKHQATREELALPIANVVAQNIVSRAYAYKLINTSPSMYVLNADGMKVVWYDYESNKEHCRFGEYYPRVFSPKELKKADAPKEKDFRIPKEWEVEPGRIQAAVIEWLKPKSESTADTILDNVRGLFQRVDKEPTKENVELLMTAVVSLYMSEYKYKETVIE